MKINEVKKILNDHFKPSSLTVIPFRTIREKYDIPQTITDNQIIGVARSLHFDIFGESRIMGDV